MSTGRNTTTRDKHRAAVSKGHPPCHWCGNDIDYQAHHLDPFAFQVDHVTSLHKGGTDTLDNCVPSHRACNRAKSDKHPGLQQAGVTYITDRNWWS